MPNRNRSRSTVDGHHRWSSTPGPDLGILSNRGVRPALATTRVGQVAPVPSMPAASGADDAESLIYLPCPLTRSPLCTVG